MFLRRKVPLLISSSPMTVVYGIWVAAAYSMALPTLGLAVQIIVGIPWARNWLAKVWQ